MTDPREPLLHNHEPESAHWSCLYAPHRDAPRCGRPATWHGLILTWDATALRDVTTSCDQHLDNMARIADFVHTLDSVCGLPGSMCNWDGPTGRSWCELDWDPGLGLLAQAVSGVAT